MEYCSFIQKSNWEHGKEEAGSAQMYKVRRAKLSEQLCCPCHLSARYWLCRGFQHFSAERGSLSSNTFRNVFSHSFCGLKVLVLPPLSEHQICSSGHTASSQQVPAVPGKQFHMSRNMLGFLSRKCLALLEKAFCTSAILLRRVTSGNCTRVATSLERKCTAVPADRGCALPGTPWASHTNICLRWEFWGNSHAS